MASLNGNGRLQKFAFVMHCLASSSSSLIIFAFSFLEMVPQFNCNYIGSDYFFQCKESVFCSNQDIEYEIDYSSLYSLHNWVEQLSLICRPTWQVGFLGFSFCMGVFVSCTWLPHLSDIYGRKLFFQSGTAINAILITFMIFNTSYWRQAFYLFVFGMNLLNFYNIGFVYI